MAFVFFTIILVVAFIVRFKYLTIEKMWPDEALYAWYGREIFDSPLKTFTKEIIEYHPPLFSIILSLGHHFFPPELACRFIAMLLNLFGIVAVFFLGIQVSGFFVGIAASLLLAFNYYYLLFSTNILIDGPLSVFCAFLVLALTKIDTKNPLRFDILVGILASLTILLKWSGALVVPFLFVYYIAAFDQFSFPQRVKKLAIPFTMVLFTILLLLLNNYFQLGTIFPNTAALGGQHNIQPIWYYLLEIRYFLTIPWLLPFLLYGLYLIYTYDSKHTKLLLTWFAVCFFGISFAGEKDPRYALLIFPSLFLITSIGLSELIEILFKKPRLILVGKTLALIIIMVTLWNMYPLIDHTILRDGQTFAGFQDAGEWVLSEVKENSVIMAGSRRAIRYYSNERFTEMNGRIHKLPDKFEDFKKIVSETTSPVLLVVDAWEFTQPAWLYPFTPIKKRQIESTGFVLDKTVTRQIKGEDKEVIWLYKRP